MKKRTLSLLLCLVMCLSLMPMSAFAEESFSFADLPETGVTNITVPTGDYSFSEQAARAFILYWGENIKPGDEIALIDCFDVDVNGYHTWVVSVENDVISAVDGHYADLELILSAVNNPNPIYDWWINGTFTVDAEDTPITSVTISGFENPAAGATAGSRSNLTVAADAPYELETHSDDYTIWLWGGSRMKTDKAFAKNQQYNISTGLKAKDGYYFSDTCTYKLLDTSDNEVQIYAGIACEVPNAKAADIHTPAILLGESGPVTVYNIVLDPNGGSGERSVVIVEKGSVYTIPECSFGLPEGKADFAYWKASFADGSEKTFLPGEKWTADDIMTTLTAMWSEQGVPGLWLGETPVTDANKGNILGDTGTPTASFDSETNTLTLDNPDISGLHEGALIFAKNVDLTVKAADGLTLNNSHGYGIYVKNGSLTVEGNVTGTLSHSALKADNITVRGNLDFTQSKADDATIRAVVGDIEIDGNVKLNATGTSYAGGVITDNGSVRIDGDVTVSGSYYEGLVAYGGTVTMTSGQWVISAYDTAIRASDGISIPSGYTITTPAGGKISAVGENVFYYVTESNGTTVAKDVVIEPPAITDDVTYYTLTFNTNGGSAIGSVSGTYGKVIDLDKYVPTKSGFDFGGWYSDSALTNPVDEIKLNGNKTVYAKWIEKSAVFPFTDVKETDWSYDDIYYVGEKGLMQGTSETTFAPKTNTSRDMIVTILYRLVGEPAVSGTCPFTDVKSGSYYEKAITWAAANKIVSGYGDGKFGADDPITREQMATILYRFAEFMGYDVSAKANLSGYTDAGNISAYAKDALAWANAKGLVTGTSATTLSPKGSATREQVAAILHRFCENIVK